MTRIGNCTGVTCFLKKPAGQEIRTFKRKGQVSSQVAGQFKARLMSGVPENRAFYQGKTGVHVNFSAGHYRSLSSALHHHSREKLLKQHVFNLMQGDEDTHDAEGLENEALFEGILEGEMACQPTFSRFKNGSGKRAVFDLCSWGHYVDSPAGHGEIIIDTDSTDDPAHGSKQQNLKDPFSKDPKGTSVRTGSPHYILV